MNKTLSLTPAFVLHRKPFSDNSFIIDFFTLHHGRMTCIAKGVKQGKSKKAAILQSFIPLMISFSGRGEVKTLRECESVENPLKLEDVGLYSAYYVNELLLKFLHKNETHETVFASYAQLLKQLDKNISTTEPLLRQFEINLLSELGYGLQLSCTADSISPIEADKNYIYEPEQGAIEISSISAQVNGKPVISGKTLLAMQQAEFTEQHVVAECKKLMRYLIQHLLGGYNFKSREFFTTKF